MLPENLSYKILARSDMIRSAQLQTLKYNLSYVARKPVLQDIGQVRHDQVCTATKAAYIIEISDLEIAELTRTV